MTPIPMIPTFLIAFAMLNILLNSETHGFIPYDEIFRGFFVVSRLTLALALPEFMDKKLGSRIKS